MAADNRPVVALLGTGIMGAGMARNIAKAGLPLRVWNRTRANAEPLASDGATIAGTPAEAVREADVIVTMLPDAEIIQGVMGQAEPGLREGQVWVQTSTVGLAGVGKLADVAIQHELIFVDSPVLGTRKPAEDGALIVFAGGPEAAKSRAQPVFDAIGSKTVWLGEAGTASRLKLVANSWVLAVTTATGEALALARGLDVADGAARKLGRAAELGHAEEDMAAAYFACFDSV
jgi:3-hydroxyisobutyrate dehydrogenase